MTLENILTPLLIVGLAAAVIKFAISYILAFIYDINRINRALEKKLHPHRKIYKNRPGITIVLSCNNNYSAVKQTLDSLSLTRYKKCKVLLINNQSSAE